MRRGPPAGSRPQGPRHGSQRRALAASPSAAACATTSAASPVLSGAQAVINAHDGDAMAFTTRHQRRDGMHQGRWNPDRPIGGDEGVFSPGASAAAISAALLRAGAARHHPYSRDLRRHAQPDA